MYMPPVYAAPTVGMDEPCLPWVMQRCDLFEVILVTFLWFWCDLFEVMLYMVFAFPFLEKGDYFILLILLIFSSMAAAHSGELGSW